MKVALILPGNLGPYKLSIDSIKKNLIEPNGADVFILTSKKNNYIHLIKEDYKGTNYPVKVDETDEKEIRKCFGDSLKVMKYVEDVLGYDEFLKSEIDNTNKRMSVWFKDSGKKYIQGYDRKSHSLIAPVRYLSQIAILYYLTKFLSDYENETGVKYDYIIRARIDQSFDKKIIINKKTDKEEFCWASMDNFYHGTSEIMKYIGLNFIKEIGSFDNSSITDIGDYRLTMEPQFKMFIKKMEVSRDVNVFFIKEKFGIRMYKKDLYISIQNWGKYKEKYKKLTSELDCEVSSFNLPLCYISLNKVFDIIWAYYIF